MGIKATLFLLGLQKPGKAFPQTLFGAADNGALYLPSNQVTVYRDAARTTLARQYESVKGLYDLSGKGNHASIGSNDSTCRWFKDVATSKWYIRQSYESTAKRMTAPFGASMGSSCTVAFANRNTVEIRTGQTIGTSYEIPKSFWACFIINRALTAAETTALTSYLSQFCPAYNTTYDFYATSAANGGSDANDGLTPATPKTIAGGHTQLLASATGKKLAILGGTEAMAFDSGSTAAAKTHYVYYLSPTTLDKSETPGTGSSAYGINANTWTLYVYGEGNLTIQNYGNNGFGSANSATGHGYDMHIVNAFDGMTSHGTSTLTLHASTSGPNGKSAFANTGTAATANAEDCVFYAKIGSTLGGGLFGEKGTNFDHFNCDYLPDPAMTTSMAHFTWTATQASTGTATTRTVRKGRFGAPHIAIPATIPAVSACYNTTFSDCYFNGGFFQCDTAPSDMQFLRCFGPKLSVRPRRISTATWGVKHCVLKGGTSSNHLIDGAVYSAGTDTFGTGSVESNVFEGGNPAVFAVSNTTEFNAAVSLLNNGFFSNTANYTAGITADGVDVTSDPALVAATTDMEQDWAVTAAAYIGAGVSGSNIGFTASDIP